MSEASTLSAGTPSAISRPYGVLVVDDEEKVRNVLNITIRQAGFRVWPAPDGREALELYRRHHDEIDLVLLDVRMPHLDGPQTWAALQEMNACVHCCFMSGDLGNYAEQKLRNQGAVAVFHKPFRPSEVVRTLLKLVVGERAADRAFEPSIAESEENAETDVDGAEPPAGENDATPERRAASA